MGSMTPREQATAWVHDLIVRRVSDRTLDGRPDRVWTTMMIDEATALIESLQPAPAPKPRSRKVNSDGA